MSDDIARALDALVPGCEYRITDNEYDKIDWFNTNSVSCPTKEAVDAKLVELIIKRIVSIFFIKEDLSYQHDLLY